MNLNPFPDQPWWGRIIEMIVMTGCAVAVLMVLASQPDFDEVYKGVAVATGSFVVSQISSRFVQGEKKDP